jgi:hypothetical protein
MDIVALKKKLQAFAFRPTEGETWEFVWERQRELTPLRTLFWSILIRTLKRFLVKVYSVSLAVSEHWALILSFCSGITFKNEWTEIPEIPSKVELPRYECDRAPPKIFVPLPDAEIGGCARNDSLIHPQSASGAVSPMS